MVGVSHFIAAEFLCRLVESAAPDFRTERAGMALLTGRGDDLANLCGNDGIGNCKAFTELLYRRKVKPRIAQIHGDGINLKRMRIKFS